MKSRTGGYQPECTVRVFLNTDADVDYWTEALRCSASELTSALRDGNTRKGVVGRIARGRMRREAPRSS